MSTILLVTERALGEQEIANLRVLTPGEEQDTEVRVLVPAELKRNLWVQFLDQLALLDFHEAFETVSQSEPGAATVEAEAQVQLEESLALLQESGFTASGRVSTAEPVSVMKEEVEDGAEQILIVTDPHPVEDAFNIHWSNKAAETLGVPVLHVYWGTEHVDD